MYFSIASMRKAVPCSQIVRVCLLLLASGPFLPGHAQEAPKPASPTPTLAPASAPDVVTTQAGEITEDQLKQQLVGKQLFLRGGYLGESLSFNEHGEATGHPSQGSYTLSAIEIDKVRLTKHRLELEGNRFALHFLGALPNEDPSTAVDRVKITPKKKILKISIDREQVIKPKKEKEAAKGKVKMQTGPTSGVPVTSSETDTAQTTTPTPAPTSEPAPAQPAEVPAADQTGDRPADQASVTSTVSPAHAAQVLHQAIDKVFATGLDEKLRAQMPDFWQLYYQAQAAGVDYRPKDPKVLHSNAVDTQAKVVSSIAPDSNEFAQASGIAGRALYRAVIGADGKPTEIAVVRPIGFGLDENAVAAIQKASFQPATKNGQPVAESLDLAVLFRIYSKRTAVAASDSQSADASKPAEPVRPGPYSVKAPPSQP